jgi:bifunctional non-homologous end joining protein LigD
VPVSWDELKYLTQANGISLDAAKDRAAKPSPLDAPQAKGIGKSVVEALDAWSKA